MTPPAATTIAARRTGSRRGGARRRRWLLGLCGIAAAVAVVVLATPLFQKAIQELTLPIAHEDIIRQQAAEKHLDPALIAAVIYAESKFDPRPSSAGAEGLMQLMPQTAEFLARRSGGTRFTPADLGTPQINIEYGSYYLRYLLDQYGGQEMLAIAAYNAGETNVDRWVAEARAAGSPLTVNEIPFPQTRAYVEKVLQAQRDYRHTYAKQLGYG
jgi:soluble lytic murein transglycosylase